MEKEKLKTLKEIIPVGRCWGHNVYNDLRAEAVKIIKDERWDEFINWCRFTKKIDWFDINEDGVRSINLFLEWWLNLTEEDLA